MCIFICVRFEIFSSLIICLFLVLLVPLLPTHASVICLLAHTRALLPNRFLGWADPGKFLLLSCFASFPGTNQSVLLVHFIFLKKQPDSFL